MAVVLYGSIVTELKGKIQGQVFQGGNVGYTLRNKGYTAGIKSANRSAKTSILVSVTTLWRTLSDAQRADWNAAAASWQFINKFGIPYYGSGYQVFVAYNIILLNEGNDPALVPATPATPTDPGAIQLLSSGTGNLELSYNNPDLTGSTMGVFASRPVSVGRNGNHLPMYLLGYYDYSSGSNLNLISMYHTVVGSLVSGSKVFVRTTCNRQDWSYPYFKQNSFCTIP